MNERIRQLAEQATRKYDRLGNEIPFAQPDLEEFAQLIVRECCNIADEVERADMDSLASKFIRAHFGVKE